MCMLFGYMGPYFKALRTHILRLLGPKTILYKAFGLGEPSRELDCLVLPTQDESWPLAAQASWGAAGNNNLKPKSETQQRRQCQGEACRCRSFIKIGQLCFGILIFDTLMPFLLAEFVTVVS